MSRLTPKQLETLSEPNVRALARAVFAEPLLELLERQSVSADSLQHRNSPLFPLDTARLNWLQALDQRPDTLLSHLSKSPSHRLGIYYERLWQFFLQQDPMVNPIAFNFAVRSGSQTLGEFDALFEHSERGLVHLELAVKFYLAKAAKPHTWASWLGPGKQDRLDLKLNRMLNRQANLGDVNDSVDALEVAFGTDMATRISSGNYYRHVLIGGRLFYPWQNTPHTTRPLGTGSNGHRASLTTPMALNTDLASGWHLPLSYWQQSLFGHDPIIYCAHKLAWLDQPCIATRPEHHLAQQRLQRGDKHLVEEKIENSCYPVMTLQRWREPGTDRLKDELKGDSGEKWRAVFVTPDDW